MRQFLKLAFKIFGLGTLTLTSCIRAKYGIPADIDDYKAIKVVTENN